MALREQGFWDQHYEEELKNFNDAGDEGDVWFGKGLLKKISARIVDIVKDRAPEDRQNVRILDIGCGNAFLLVNIASKFETELDNTTYSLLGLDYASNSIELCKQIIGTKNLKGNISFHQCDFLRADQLKLITSEQRFNFVIDVGTHDAICLLGCENETRLNDTKRNYMISLYLSVERGTIFVLASCNHTKDELLDLFSIDCPGKRYIEVIGCIETPTLQFGGKTGSQVCCLLLEFK